MHFAFTGNQPKGKMKIHIDASASLPGHEHCGTIVLDFDIPSGVQGA